MRMESFVPRSYHDLFSEGLERTCPQAIPFAKSEITLVYRNGTRIG